MADPIRRRLNLDEAGLNPGLGNGQYREALRAILALCDDADFHAAGDIRATIADKLGVAA